MMTTTETTSFVPAVVSPEFDSFTVRQAVAGFLAGYGETTRQAYSLDLRQWLHWCDEHELRVFEVRRAHIELFGRSLEQDGKARATVARRLSTVAGFYRYCFEEELISRSPAAHVRRPRVDYESTVSGLDRNELGMFLVQAGLCAGRDHAFHTKWRRPAQTCRFEGWRGCAISCVLVSDMGGATSSPLVS